MDDQSFDRLARRLGRVASRRQVIKAITGAVVGVIAGSRAVTAQTCVPHYSPCTGDADCCAGAVCEYGVCMPGCRVDGVFHHAWTSPPENICGQCQPEISTTSLIPVNEGMACWSGDPNAGFTTCQGGVCRGEAPQSCPPPTPCFLEGKVDPATGLCVNPPAPEGTLCGNGPVCAGGFYQPADTCDGNGFCIGGGSRTVACEPVDACTPARCADGACNTVTDCPVGSLCNAETAECMVIEHPLFNCGPGYTCPTGATTFSWTGSLDPTSSDQAKAACEACFGVGNCHLDLYDCAGHAWTTSYNVPAFGFQESYCDDWGLYPDPVPSVGRVFRYGQSFPVNDYGYWAIDTCPVGASRQSVSEDDQPPTNVQP